MKVIHRQGFAFSLLCCVAVACSDTSDDPDLQGDSNSDPQDHSNSEPDPFDHGLLAHWTFNETDGPIATDISGHDRHGTIVGPVRTEGVEGGALRFDGVNDYVEVETSGAMNPFPLSISLWIRTSTSTGLAGIVNKYLPESQDGYQVFLHEGRLCAWYFRDGSSHVYDGSGTCTLGVDGVNDGVWHHVVFIVDDTGGRVFVDGQEASTQAWTGEAGPASSPALLRFGHYPGAASHTAFFDGDIDDIRMWNRPLTPSEIANLSWSTAAMPVISDVRIETSPTTAAIHWTTSLPATGRVLWGPTPDLEQRTDWTTEAVVVHSHHLENLEADRTYHFRIEVASGDDTAQTEIATFTTPSGQAFPGGFLEPGDSTPNRTLPSFEELQALMPERGPFTFPSPYDTVGVRLTNETDCGGSSDCVNYVGYSYWANINNHVGSDIMYIFLGLDANRGGTGPTLFSYDKVTDEVRNLGPLVGGALEAFSGEGWYFSATQPTKLYTLQGSQMRRWDILDHSDEVVYDVTDEFGPGHYLWQMSSSYDDKVHAGTLRRSSDYAMLGCVVYREEHEEFLFFPHLGRGLDECQLDKSGRWLLIKEDIDGLHGEDNRILDLVNGTETHLLDPDGAAGHSDNGFGYMVATDNYLDPYAVRLWKFDQSPLEGPVVYMNASWQSIGGGPNHIAHGNARPDVPPEDQYACGSNATRDLSQPRSNEVICFRLDGSGQTLVVAPVMTDTGASGGRDDYGRSPKGNVDVTGRYFIWTSNVGSGRLDAFIVKIPAERLDR
jgi:hypothetical protein